MDSKVIERKYRVVDAINKDISIRPINECIRPVIETQLNNNNDLLEAFW